MQPNPLRQSWNAGKRTTCVLVSIPSAWTVEVLAHAGYDSLFLDMQHGLYDYQTTVQMLQAISGTDTVPLVRVPWNEPSILMKMLDAGAIGIICPMIDTAEDTAAFVRACRYPPQGIRSYGPMRAALHGGADYFQRANEEVLTIAMIETAAAIENLEAIAATPGLDGLFVGPFDLSASLGMDQLADFSNPALLATLQKVISACEKNKLVAGIFTVRPEDAALSAEMGFKLIAYHSDNGMFGEVVRAKLAGLKAILQRLE